MTPRMLPPLLALSTAISLASCATSTPLAPERPVLPAAPAAFGKPVEPPAIASGQSLRVTAMQHRAALHEANRRLDGDAAFYEGVRQEFGQTAESEAR
jgi:hypothetical protein